MVLEEVLEGSNPLYQEIKWKKTLEDEVTESKTQKPLWSIAELRNNRGDFNRDTK